MGFAHTMFLKAKMAKGASKEVVMMAIRPLMDYWGDESYWTGTDNTFSFNRKNGALTIATFGEVGYGYEEILRETAKYLNGFVVEAGEIVLIDHDTGNIDEAKTVIEFGPSEEAIKAYIAKRDIEAGLKMMEPHLSNEVIEAVKQIVFGQGRGKK